jgi:hypothetical protein
MNLVFFLEEPSARELLKGLLPRLVPSQIVPYYIVFEGKQDLDKQMIRKMQYWNKPNSKFIVLRDQDSADCMKVKEGLLAKCKTAGKEQDAMVRIACHEIESWYLGDLAAVEAGLSISGIKSQQLKAKYRNPDYLNNASQELIHLTKHKYQKISGSRSIARYLSLDQNLSKSFQVFISAVSRVCETSTIHR